MSSSREESKKAGHQNRRVICNTSIKNSIQNTLKSLTNPYRVNPIKKSAKRLE